MVVLLLGGLLCLAGCNYIVSSTFDNYPTRTVEFTTAENQLYPPRPGLEYELTHRLKDEIAGDRRLKLVAGGADIQLRVTLVGFDEPTIVKDLDTALPSEVLVRATVVIEATGEGVWGGQIRRRISASDGYAPALGESRQDALVRLWRDLSRQIIDAATDREWAEK